MKKLLCSASLAAVMFGMAGIGAANAVGTVTIGLATGGAITNEGSAPTTDSFIGVFSGFAVQVSGTTVAPSSLNLSNTIDVSGGGCLVACELDVYVTASGLTAAGGYPIGAVNFSSIFQGNLIPAGWTVTESTYVSNTNALFTGAILSASPGFTTSGSTNTQSITATAIDPYSVTDKFVILALGLPSGTTNDNISLTGEPGNRQGIPGPIAGAGLPGLLILGFGGLLVWRRRRGQNDVAGHALAV